MLTKLICAVALLSTTAHAATFGEQSPLGTNVGIRDNVAALIASPSQSGICDSITVYLKFNFDSSKVRCALYTVSGTDTVLVTNGVTEERGFDANGAFIWHGFAFADPKPWVSAGATYFIAAFADTAGAGGSGLARVASGSGGGAYVNKAADYESGFPATLNPANSIIGSRLSIYVTYHLVSSIAPRRRALVSRPSFAP